MGLVLQRQRRANEALAPHVQKPWPTEAFDHGSFSFYLERPGYPTALACVGISGGFGTCSDLHGVSIVVLEYRFWDVTETPSAKVEAQELSACKYAVLLWPRGMRVVQAPEHLPTGLRRIDPQVIDPFAAERTVELLEFSSFNRDSDSNPEKGNQATRIYLNRTGIISSYVPL